MGRHRGRAKHPQPEHPGGLPTHESADAPPTAGRADARLFSGARRCKQQQRRAPRPLQWRQPLKECARRGPAGLHLSLWLPTTQADCAEYGAECRVPAHRCGRPHALRYDGYPARPALHCPLPARPHVLSHRASSHPARPHVAPRHDVAPAAHVAAAAAAAWSGEHGAASRALLRRVSRPGKACAGFYQPAISRWAARRGGEGGGRYHRLGATRAGPVG